MYVGRAGPLAGALVRPLAHARFHPHPVEDLFGRLALDCCAYKLRVVGHEGPSRPGRLLPVGSLASGADGEPHEQVRRLWAEASEGLVDDWYNKVALPDSIDVLCIDAFSAEELPMAAKVPASPVPPSAEEMGVMFLSSSSMWCMPSGAPRMTTASGLAPLEKLS